MPLADLIIFSGIGTTFAIVIVAVTLEAASRRRARLRRVDGVRQRAIGSRVKNVAGAQVQVKRDPNAGGSTLGRLVAGWLPRQSALKERLAQTGREIPLGRYGTFILGCILLIFAVLALPLRFPWPVAALLAVALGLYVPHFVTGVLIKRRAGRFIASFAEAIELMVRGLRSGLPVLETVSTISREMPDPIGTEFRRVVDSVRFGQSLEEAFWAATKRIAAPEFKFLVITLAIQRETGGNLAETLSNLADIIRRRRQMRLKIKAMSSEARASAYILGSLPFVLFGIIYTINPGYALVLFTDPRGILALGVGLLLIATAMFTMYKMIRFEI